ncbi:MAG TPA: EpsI family protein [Chthoniobacterales bacterium]|nr:EpsI family protein [Chthoniobacterales bacterium]
MIVKRLFAIELSLLLGLGAIFVLPSSPKNSPAGISLQLPIWVGTWLGEDAEVTARELEVLAKDTEFGRKVYRSPKGDQIFVSIVMSGDDMTSSIHRPERCLPAQGWNLQSSQERDITLNSGKSLTVTKLRTYRPIQVSGQERRVLYSLNYYWFVGYTDTTASHTMRTAIDLRDRLLKGYNQKWAYVTVTSPVSESWGGPNRSESQTAAMLEEFIKNLLPVLHRPDGHPLM